MVVFGAGASYDSIPARNPREPRYLRLPDRLPLANELFDDRPEFVSDLAQLPECHPVVPYLRHLADDSSLERVLERLQAEADEYPERHRQLAAVRYYLHLMLSGCESRWLHIAQGVTNQKTLLDQIRRWNRKREPVCLVTFNYDRMLEHALSSIGVSTATMASYISSEEFQLIKLHGSIHWAREISTRLQADDPWHRVHEIIHKVTELEITNRYVMVGDPPIVNFGASFPAVAIPVETKKNYECPEEHFKALVEFLPKVTKLLCIGWRATEQYFLSLLSGRVPTGVRVLSVAGSKNAALETNARLAAAKVVGDFEPAPAGFTEFVVQRQGDGFFRM